MLVLSRKVGETILIGPDIEVMVTRICGSRVTLGVSAPRATSVLRAECGPYRTSQVRDAMQEEVHDAG